jgi:hypothetical protein
MEKKGKDGQRPSQGANVHPETQQPVRPGVADDHSSKTGPAKQPDARTSHDKDANENLAGTSQERR